jgi:hypothetical protein
MDSKITSIGYDLEPSRYAPLLGYSRLRVLISDKPTQRFFDVKQLSIPTFDGRFLRHTQVTRHELAPTESFQVCVGELRLETYQGEILRAFSLGGNLHASVEMGDLYCEYTSTAPILKVDDDPNSVNRVIADEIADLLAENESKLVGHEDELYTRLSKFDPYAIFLSCMVSLQALVDNVPMGVRRERFHKASASIQRAIHIVRETDGWDGHAPSLEELLSSGGVL